MENLDMNMTLAEATAKEAANLSTESAPKEEATHEPEVQETAEASSEETSEAPEAAEAHAETESEDTGKLEPWVARRLGRTKGQLERERAQNEMLRQQAEMLTRQLHQQSGVYQSNYPAQSQQIDLSQPLTEDRLMQLVDKGLQKRQQDEAVRQQALQQEEEFRKHQAFQDQIDQGQDKFADYGTVVKQGIAFTPVMRHALMEMNLPDPDIFLYSVAKNQAKRLEKISQLPPIQQVIQMGELMAEHKQKSKPKLVSKAPAPVTSKLKTSSGSVAKKDPQDMSIDDFMEFSRNSRRR